MVVSADNVDTAVENSL